MVLTHVHIPELKTLGFYAPCSLPQWIVELYSLREKILDRTNCVQSQKVALAEQRMAEETRCNQTLLFNQEVHPPPRPKPQPAPRRHTPIPISAVPTSAAVTAQSLTRRHRLPSKTAPVP